MAKMEGSRRRNAQRRKRREERPLALECFLEHIESIKQELVSNGRPQTGRCRHRQIRDLVKDGLKIQL